MPFLFVSQLTDSFYIRLLWVLIGISERYGCYLANCVKVILGLESAYSRSVLSLTVVLCRYQQINFP